MKMKPSKINPLIYYVEKWLNDLPKKFEHRKFFLSMSNHSSTLSMSRLRRSVLIKKNLINFFHASFSIPAEKGVLRNLTKFRGKHLCQRLVQVFSCQFCEISKNTFFTEHLRWMLLPV